MKIVSLGGSGEESRNCFLVECSNTSFLLDCGVRREVSTLERVYPNIDAKIAKTISFVFLSHAHEDHCAAIPFLYHLGFNGYVYCSEETSKTALKFMRKWHDFCVKTENILPFSLQDIESVKFITISTGINEIEGMKVMCGRSGHTQGSLWAQFITDGQKLLYTGDTTNQGLLLKTDIFPQSDVLICDSAYSDLSLSQDEQYQTIFNCVSETLTNGGTALLPVPGNGRGIDIALYLSSKGLKVFTDKSIISNAKTLSESDKWAKNTFLWNELDNLKVIESDLQNKVIVVPDGMVTTGEALNCYEKLKSDCKSMIIITGHTACGSIGSMVFDENYRKENNVQMIASRIKIKVHPDYNDVLDICKQVKPKSIMLFHSEKERCISLKATIEKLGINVL